MNKYNFPKRLPVFPLLNVIFFPKMTLPLNIFEKRYLEMVNDSIKNDRLIGIIQPKINKKKPELYSVGCLGKITSFNETQDGRMLLILDGITRFKLKKEIKSKKLYREFFVDYNDFKEDPEIKIEKNFKYLINMENFYNRIKILFKKKGYSIDWSELEDLNINEIINTISMISPFSAQEKQSLLESKNIDERFNALKKITDIYLVDKYYNKTVQ